MNLSIEIYVPTYRHKKIEELEHLVLVRIKGLKIMPKMMGNILSNALLKSRFQNFAAYRWGEKRRFASFFLAGITETNDAHLQSFFFIRTAVRTYTYLYLYLENYTCNLSRWSGMKLRHY